MKVSRLHRRAAIAVLVEKAEKLAEEAINPKLFKTKTFNHRLARYAALRRVWLQEQGRMA